MGRLVEGQPTADGVQAQVTSGGFEGQGFVAQDDADARTVEGQCAEDDTAEGQENDARPFSERRPYPDTQGTSPTGTRDTRDGNGLPPSARRFGGSVDR